MGGCNGKRERERVQYYYGKRASGRRAVGSGRRENKRLARCDQCQNRKGEEREGEVGEREAKEGRVKREGGIGKQTARSTN